MNSKQMNGLKWKLSVFWIDFWIEIENIIIP